MSTISLIIIIAFIITLILSIYTLISIVRHHDKYGTKVSAILNFLAIFNAVLIYSSLYMLSVFVLISENINILLWKICLISGVISLFITSLIYSFLEKFKSVPYFPFLIFTILGGILIGSFFSSTSIQITVNSLNSPPFFVI